MKRLLALATLFALTACTSNPIVLDEPQQPPSDNSNTSISSESSDSSVSSESSERITNNEPTNNIPPSVKIAMDFASQAPHGNWDMPYQEACEEASLIMVHHYLEKKPLNADIMDKAILDMVAHEESQGLPADIDMIQLANVAEELYGYDTEVVEGPAVTIDRIKQEIANGNPVILPLAGRLLGNPYYSGSGPPYHVLVVNGYTNKRFITHDVGTRRGEYYEYTYAVLNNAIHDWIGDKELIVRGPRRMLIVRKKA